MKITTNELKDIIKEARTVLSVIRDPEAKPNATVLIEKEN